MQRHKGEPIDPLQTCQEIDWTLSPLPSLLRVGLQAPLLPIAINESPHTEHQLRLREDQITQAILSLNSLTGSSGKW